MRPGLKKLEELRPLEPPHRNATYYDLAQSIKRHGLFIPLVVTPGGLIVDGSRRHSILGEIGETYVNVAVLEEEPDESELWEIRAELNYRRRNPSPEEILRASGHNTSADQKDFTVPDELEHLIEEVFAAKGFGPRLLQRIARQITVIFPDCEGEDPANALHNLLELFKTNGSSWK